MCSSSIEGWLQPWSSEIKKNEINQNFQIENALNQNMVKRIHNNIHVWYTYLIIFNLEFSVKYIIKKIGNLNFTLYYNIIILYNVI